MGLTSNYEEVADELAKEMGYSSWEVYFKELIDSGSYYSMERIVKFSKEVEVRYDKSTGFKLR